ncbi:hypothetical protein F7R06_02295 [Pseudomonas moorei]|nr:hypothetical protein F7R06_02295 [Pseudomonas moorei]
MERKRLFSGLKFGQQERPDMIPTPLRHESPFVSPGRRPRSQFSGEYGRLFGTATSRDIMGRVFPEEIQ